MEPDDFILKLAKQLREPLPGEEIQYQMAPHYRQRGSFGTINEAEYRHSAVLALLCRRNADDWFLPLTLRASYNGPHSAQVSLPGGRYEEMDGNLANTALRECYEEIGLRENIEMLGRLTPLHIPVSRYIVHPFVAWHNGSQVTFTSHEREVKAILEAPLKVILEDACRATAKFETDGGVLVEAPCFNIEESRVWGATAMILNELKQLIRQACDLTI